MGMTRTTHPRAVTLAERMGRRAGELLRDAGTPARMPAALARREDLAAAWRRGYLAAIAGRRP